MTRLLDSTFLSAASFTDLAIRAGRGCVGSELGVSFFKFLLGLLSSCICRFMGLISDSIMRLVGFLGFVCCIFWSLLFQRA